MSLVNKLKSKFNVGQLKYERGRRYKFNKNSRWERAYATGNPAYKSGEGFIHRDSDSSDLMKRSGNIDNTILQRISGVKTYGGKTKSELREEYMFSRGRLTNIQKILQGTAVVYASIHTLKNVRTTNPFIRQVTSISGEIVKTSAWTTPHAKLSKAFDTTARELEKTYLPRKVRQGVTKFSEGYLGRTERTFARRQRQYAGAKQALRKSFKADRLAGLKGRVRSPQTIKKAFRYFKAQRAYYPLRNVRGLVKGASIYVKKWQPTKAAGLFRFLHKYPQLAVGATLAASIGAIKLAKYAKARKFTHDVESREYEYKLRER